MNRAFSSLLRVNGALARQSQHVRPQNLASSLVTLQGKLGQYSLFMTPMQARAMSFKETRATLIPKKQPKDQTHPAPQQQQQAASQNELTHTEQNQVDQQAAHEQFRQQLQQQLQDAANQPIPMKTLMKDAFVWGVGVTLAFMVVGAIFR